MVDEIQTYCENIQLMEIEAENKATQKIALEEKCGNLPKNLQRKTYVDRIMDIIKQIHKQKLEIDKVSVKYRLVVGVCDLRK